MLKKSYIAFSVHCGTFTQPNAQLFYHVREFYLIYRGNNSGAARLRQIEQSFHIAATEDVPVVVPPPPALPPPMFQSSSSSNKKKVTIVEDKNTESCV